MPKKKKGLPVTKTKDSFKIENPIEVDGNSSTLTVKIDLTQGKGVTWGVSTKITTTQVSTTNEEITEGTLQTVMSMLRQGIQVAIEKRHQRLLDMSGGDPDQLQLLLGGTSSDQEEVSDELPL